MKSEGKKKANQVPTKLMLAWNSRSVSMAISVVLMMQVTYYSTEILGIGSAAVGALFMAAKLFDGVTDLIAGFIIDKTNTKLGKARPYELFIIPLWLLIIAFYSTPDIGTTGKMIYIFVTYVLINSVCATFLQSCETVFLGRAVKEDAKRAKILSIGGVIVMLFSAVSSILLPQLMANLGTQPGGWSKIALIYGVPMLLIGICRFLFVKEIPIDQESEDKNKVGFVEGLKLVAKNKYIFMFSLLVLLSFLLTNTLSIVGTYYFTYIFGNLGLMSVIGMLSLLSPFFFLLFPVAIRTIGSISFVKFGLAVALIAAVIRFFFPSNLMVIVVTTLLISVGSQTLTMMNHYFILQCIDYGEIKTGKRVEGTPTAIASFANKVGSGVASLLVGGFMALFGFISSASVQTDSAILSIRLLYSVIPAVILVIMLIVVHFFDVEKVLAKLRPQAEAES